MWNYFRALGHEWLISIKSNGVIPGDASLRDFAHKWRSAYTYKSAPAVSGEQRKRRHRSSLTSKLYWQFTFALSTAENFHCCSSSIELRIKLKEAILKPGLGGLKGKVVGRAAHK